MGTCRCKGLEGSPLVTGHSHGLRPALLLAQQPRERLLAWGGQHSRRSAAAPRRARRPPRASTPLSGRAPGPPPARTTARALPRNHRRSRGEHSHHCSESCHRGAGDNADGDSPALPGVSADHAYASARAACLECKPTHPAGESSSTRSLTSSLGAAACAGGNQSPGPVRLDWRAIAVANRRSMSGRHVSA